MASAAEVRLAIRAVNEASRVLQEVRGDLQSVQREAGVIDRAMGAVEGVVGRLGGALTAPFRAAVGAVRAFGSALADIGKTALGVAAGVAVFQGVGSLFSTARSGVIGMNALLERSTLQFQTLLGSADAAREHVEGLFRFAAATPFETEPILNASRLLLTFGGTALGTTENLRLVGDAAAVAGRDIGEVAFWVGRAYSAIQAGKPFGQAAMRLQEMGVLSATARARIEDLAASGASSAEVWAALQEELGRFSGAMKLQAGTWQGLTSTISDNIQMLTATAFKPLFELLKAGAAGLAEFLQSDTAAAWAERIAGAIQGVIDRLRPMAEQWLPRLKELFQGLGEGGAVSGILALLNPLGTLAREALPALMPLLESLMGVLVEVAQAVGPPVAQLFQTLGQVIRDVLAAALPPLLPVLQQLGQLLADAAAQLLPPFVSLLEQLAPVIGQVLAALAPLIAEGLMVLVEQALPPLVDLLAQVLTWMSENEAVVQALAVALGLVLVALNPIPAAILGVITVLGLMKGHWDDIVRFFTETVPGAAQAVVDAILGIPVVGPIIQGFLDTMRIAFQTAWDTIRIIVETALGVIQGIINVVLGLITGDWDRAWSGIQGIADSIWQGIRDLVETAIGMVRGIIETQLQVIKGVWDTAWSGIRDAAGGAIDAVVGFATELPGRILGALSGLGQLLWDLAKGAFQRIKDGGEDAWVTVLGWLAALPGRILGAIGDLGRLLWDVGRSILMGLLDGMKAAWNEVAGWLSGLGGKIKSLKGPPAQDARLLVGVGELIMQGLARGLQAGWQEQVVPLLRGMTVSIPQQAAPATLAAAAAAPAMPAAPAPAPVPSAWADRPIIIQLNGREVARAMLGDLLAEAERQGVRL